MIAKIANVAKIAKIENTANTVNIKIAKVGISKKQLVELAAIVVAEQLTFRNESQITRGEKTHTKAPKT